MTPSSSVRLDLEERRNRVDGLLARHGTTTEHALTYVSSAFGDPQLVVATGSLPAGYGNENSDCDLWVVVPDSDLFQLPIPAVEDDLRVDVRYFSAGELRDYVELVDVPWPSPGQVVTRRDHNNRRNLLEWSVRFAVGVTLVDTPEWAQWKASLEAADLTGAVVRFWALETIRRLVAAELLQDESIASAYRYAAVAQAALHAETSRRSHIFFGSKWLSEKLRQIDDTELTSVFQRSFEYPMTAETRDAIAAFARGASKDVDHAEAMVFLAPGTEVHRALGRTFVSRWALRGVEMDGDRPALVGDDDSALWRGSTEQSMPPDLRELFRQDYLWLTVGVGDG